MKILILKGAEDDFEQYFIRNMQKENISVEPVYRRLKKYIRYFAIISSKYLPFLFYSYWYGGWKHNINKYDCIIIFDRIWSYDIIKYIKNKNKKCRLIFWYWNKVKAQMPEQYQKYCEIWSFDESDCEKYRFNHNVQFYIRDFKKRQKTIKYDALFIGKDKGRMQIILDIAECLNKYNFISKICIVCDGNKQNRNNVNCVSHTIDYEKILDYLAESRCIIDIVQEEQSGITLRVLEALFYNKKLITNNKTIKDAPYYNENNIFLWGVDDEKNLSDFFSAPYYNIDKSLISRYSYKQWIENFGLEIEN